MQNLYSMMSIDVDQDIQHHVSFGCLFVLTRLNLFACVGLHEL